MANAGTTQFPPLRFGVIPVVRPIWLLISPLQCVVVVPHDAILTDRATLPSNGTEKEKGTS